MSFKKYMNLHTAHLIVRLRFLDTTLWDQQL